MKIAEARKAGKILERSGIASRIIALADDISQGTYKNAMERAGQIAILAKAASCDEYWGGKVILGEQREADILNGLVEGVLMRDRVAFRCNPYLPGE